MVLVFWTPHIQVGAAELIPLDFSASHNCRLQTLLGPASLVGQFPEGDVELLGVPFSIPVGVDNAWHSTTYYNPGPNPRTVDISVDMTGVRTVYTLINTFGGLTGGPYAWIEFYGQDPVNPVFTKQLFGNVDIRDFLENRWTNNINGTSTLNAFSAGPGGYDHEVRLDMQIIPLPVDFEMETLTRIRLVDNGPLNDQQRTFLAGVTVEVGPTTVPIDIKPGSYPNSINLGSNGVVPVAILSTVNFDASTVDETTVVLAGAFVAIRGKNRYLASVEDVNGDGLLDLVCHVETENLDPGTFQDGFAFLSAETFDGVSIEGFDEITIVPPE
jgi:hypothetical protein